MKICYYILRYASDSVALCEMFFYEHKNDSLEPTTRRPRATLRIINDNNIITHIAYNYIIIIVLTYEL